MSIVGAFRNSKNFSKLLIRGKDQAFLTPEEINDAIPADIVDTDMIDEIMFKIQEAKIEVQNQEFDEDDDGIRLDGTEIIEETLSKEEKAEPSDRKPVEIHSDADQQKTSKDVQTKAFSWLEKMPECIGPIQD